MDMKERSYYISQISVPVVEYRYEKEKAGVSGQMESTYEIQMKAPFTEDRGIAFPCAVTADIHAPGITAKIVAEAIVGINGEKEAPNDEEMKQVTRVFSAPLRAKITEIFAYLTGNTKPFPIILRGEPAEN